MVSRDPAGRLNVYDGFWSTNGGFMGYLMESMTRIMAIFTCLGGGLTCGVMLVLSLLMGAYLHSAIFVLLGIVGSLYLRDGFKELSRVRRSS